MSEISCLRPISYKCQSPIPHNSIPCISNPILLPYMESSSVFCLHTAIALLIVVQHEKDTWIDHCTKFPGKTPGRFPVLRVCYVVKPHRAEEVEGGGGSGPCRLAPELGAHSARVTWHAGVNLRCQFPLLELLTAISS